ncbi:MAG: homocysteine S-methyltransferase family protein, partial [Candidatus Latescibacterota bacterium]
VLAEGSIIERIRRDPSVNLDPHVENAGLVYNSRGRHVLRSIYRGYLDIAREYDREMIVLAPTWRTNPERVARAGLGDVVAVNRDCVDFVLSVRDDYDDFGRKILIGGLMACKNDAYRPNEALTEEQAAEFHMAQAEALSSTQVDFILVSTLPARSEAVGIARALARTGVPFVLSYIVRADGSLLDGSPLNETIDIIDASVSPAPVFHMLNCVHPSVCERGVAAATEARARIKGLQANTSLKTPEELEGSDTLDEAAPDLFADAMIRVHEGTNINILGGCCGTDERHIRAIAERLG